MEFSSIASQVTGYPGFLLDVCALVLPVEPSHGFAQLEFLKGPERRSPILVQISFCPDGHVCVH